MEPKIWIDIPAVEIIRQLQAPNTTMLQFRPTQDNDVNINDVEIAVSAIEGAICSYEHPGYFDITWTGRVYALGTANGHWNFQSAESDDEYDNWGADSDVELPLTATTEELIVFIKEHILINPTKGKIHYCGGTSIVEVIQENAKSFTVINVGRHGLSSPDEGFDPRAAEHKHLRYHVAKGKLIIN